MKTDNNVCNEIVLPFLDKVTPELAELYLDDAILYFALTTLPDIYEQHKKQDVVLFLSELKEVLHKVFLQTK